MEGVLAVIMPSTGHTVLHYELGDKLGAGGMGEVFRARDTRLGREVALKFISPQYREDTDRRSRLLKEAQAASALRSPAIATTYDIGEEGLDLFIVMELVEGEPLSDRLKRGPLRVAEVLRMAGQVADALDEAHGLGIIHRDIKSANLIMTPRGRVKILDFGLAKTIGRGALGEQQTMAETQLGMVVGTVSYMSPEQALGKKVDHRSDLFSLGVVMYESLTGRLPFVGDTFAAVVDQILRQEPPALARLNYDAPARLQDIVRKLLTKSATARYQNARDLLIDIKTLQKDLELETQLGSTDLSSVTRAPAVPTKRTVAVLPFANITRERLTIGSAPASLKRSRPISRPFRASPYSGVSASSTPCETSARATPATWTSGSRSMSGDSSARRGWLAVDISVSAI